MTHELLLHRPGRFANHVEMVGTTRVWDSQPGLGGWAERAAGRVRKVRRQATGEQLDSTRLACV
jgi:hypothetical protein